MPEFQPTHSAPHVLAEVEPPLDGFTVAYLVAAEWTLPEPQEDDSEGPSSEDAIGWSPEAIEDARVDCASFQAQNVADLGAAYASKDVSYSEERAGHDFWLTRNHHGAGFWDRGLGEVGDRLTEAAHSHGGVDAYVGDDCYLYFM